MATEENQTHVGTVVLERGSPPTSGSKIREARRLNDSRDVRRHPDQLWQSKQRSSPSLLFYRKLSCDGENGTILDRDNDCFDYGSGLLSAEEKLNPEQLVGKRIEGIPNAFTPVPGKGSEGSPCQLDVGGVGMNVGRNTTGGARCSCTLSSLNTGPESNCCHSPRSSPSPSSSPAHSPCLSPSLSGPNQRHIRRSSLPVSMLAFYKVIRKDGASSGNPWYLYIYVTVPSVLCSLCGLTFTL